VHFDNRAADVAGFRIPRHHVTDFEPLDRHHWSALAEHGQAEPNHRG
jgi:hypothetical protein